MPILVRQNGGKSIANSEDYDLANDVTEIVDSLNVNAPVSSLAQRNALVPFEGMTIVRTDLKGMIEVYVDGVWTGSGSTAVTTFGGADAGSKWLALTGGHVPRLYRTGGMVFLVGGVRRQTAGSDDILTVPTSFRPSTTATMFVGAGVSSDGAAYELALENGKLHIPTGYVSASIPTNSVISVTCQWPLF